MLRPDHSTDSSSQHVQQRDAITELSQRALTADGLDELFEETVRTVKTALSADYCAIFERSATGETLTPRGASGLDGTSEQAASNTRSHLERAAVGTEPIIIDELGDEERRSASGWLVERGLHSVIASTVGRPGEPWGVLAAYGTERDAFTERDVAFLTSVVNVLTAAIENDRMRRRLRAEETVKDRIAETSPIGILQLNSDGEIEFANGRAAEILGRDRIQLESMANDDPHWEFVDGDGEPLSRAAIPSERVLREGTRLLGVEVGVRGANGDRVWLSVNGEPLRDDDGSVTGAVLALKDVTDRKRLEGELEEIFGRVTDAFYALDEQWRFTHVNERAEELIDFTGEGLVGEHVWEAFEWAADSKLRKEYERAMDTREPVSFELYYPEPLDAWYEIDAYPSESGLSVYFRDVSERKRMEQERHASNHALQQLHAIASDRASSFDEKVERLLDLGRDLLGLEVGYLAAADPDADRFEVTHASGESEHVSSGAKLPLSETYCNWVVESGDLVAFADSPPAYIDDEVYDAWGLDCYIGGPVTVDGDLYGTLCFEDEPARTQPFTAAERTFVELAIQWVSYELERGRRSERLERYREYTDDILNAIDDVFYVFGADGTLQRWNESLTDASGYTDVEVAEMHALEFFAESEHADVVDTVERVLETGSGRFESAVLTSDGDRIPYEFVASALEDPDGQPVLAGIGRDITERRAREHELEESNERLQQFAYAASHDLQEPLRMISSYLQLLDNRYADSLDEDAAEFIAFAVDGARRMQAMIDGLLAYSRVDTRGDPFEPVDCAAVLEDVRSDLAMKIEETNADLTVEPLPEVYGDASQLRQLFQNLLDNALTYTGNEPPRITVSAEQRASKWAISVRDRGIGIDSADHDRIFDVFDRLHTRQEYDGTGIGLALCQRIAERHGSTVEVDSEPGTESTFTVRLPTLPDTVTHD